MAQDLSQALAELVGREEIALKSFPEGESEVRRGGSGTWSPKEELGHLIDSATNNHVRFVRASIEPELRGTTYAQDEWVRLHDYQNMPWLTIVGFWIQYNNFLSRLIGNISDDKLATLCFIGPPEGFIGNEEGVTLRFLIEDYMLHMQHHLDHLLQRENVAKYPA